MEDIKIRDFIYLDSERLRSIIAQLEEGLVESLMQGIQRSGEIEAELKGSLVGVLTGKGGASYLWKREATETRTLHDYIYTKVEKILVENSKLVELPDGLPEEKVKNREFEGVLTETSFILAKGKISIDDFGRMRKLIERFNDLGEFLTYCEMSKIPDDVSQKEKIRTKKEIKSKHILDEKLKKGLEVVYDTFYGDLVVIRIGPYQGIPTFKLVGNLREEFLREDLHTIIFKYSTAPIAPWFIFGQVAAMPTEVQNLALEPNDTSNDLKKAIQQTFDRARDLEATAKLISFPEIAITPIAVYREMD